MRRGSLPLKVRSESNKQGFSEPTSAPALEQLSAPCCLSAPHALTPPPWPNAQVQPTLPASTSCPQKGHLLNQALTQS